MYLKAKKKNLPKVIITYFDFTAKKTLILFSDEIKLPLCSSNFPDFCHLTFREKLAPLHLILMLVCPFLK